VHLSQFIKLFVDFRLSCSQLHLQVLSYQFSEVATCFLLCIKFNIGFSFDSFNSLTVLWLETILHQYSQDDLLVVIEQIVEIHVFLLLDVAKHLDQSTLPLLEVVRCLSDKLVCF